MLYLFYGKKKPHQNNNNNDEGWSADPVASCPLIGGARRGQYKRWVDRPHEGTGRRTLRVSLFKILALLYTIIIIMSSFVFLRFI